MTGLLARVRSELARAGDVDRARGQQAYMKSAMPFHGVSSGAMRAICKRVLADYGLDERDGGRRWLADILSIWRGARFREERYAAIELAHLRGTRPLHTMHALPAFEELVVTGAWWDYVDAVAAHDLGLILRNDREPMRKAMLAWSSCEDMWKRRSSILCQLRFQRDTDVDLLYACIEPSIERKEFWLRKAIGWALRQYAKTDAAEVARYVRANEARMSGLSRREATRALTSAVAPTSSPGRGARRRSA